MTKLIHIISLACLLSIANAQHPSPPFNSSSPYNRPIPPNPALDSNQAMVDLINAAIAPLIHIYEYAPRIYYVDGNSERRIQVTCTEPWGVCELSRVRGGVSIPFGAQGAVGDDAHMVVWDTVNRVSYEFWRYRYPNGTAPEGQTSWGGYVSVAGNGVDRPKNKGLGAGGATGSDISRLAGIIRLDEVKAGIIPHALVGPTNNSCNTWRWPALKSDGWSTRADCIPEGAHMQLDPSIDLNTVSGMRPIDKMVATALQVYGWYNVDNGGEPTDGSSTKWYIQFEVDPTATGPNCPAWGGTGKEPGATYCNAGFGGDYDVLRGTCQDGSSLFSHMRVLADAAE